MTWTNRALRRWAVAFLACASPSGLAAQTVAANGRTAYPVSFFATFAPSTALDIVARVPGFNLDDGGGGRGFGQAAGNLVINGARPTSKSDSLGTILSRIPASQVERIEIGSGDLFGSEFAGKSQVVNVVLKSAGGLAGTANAALRRDFTGALTPEGNVSALLRSGRSTFNGSLGYDNGRFPERGSDTVTRIATGQRIELREKFNDARNRRVYLSGSWAHAGGVQRSANLNLRVADGRFQLDQSSRVTRPMQETSEEPLSQDFNNRDYEIGGDVTRPLAGGGVKLIGLATRRHNTGVDDFLNRRGSTVVGGFAQEAESQRDETVLRLLWSRGDWNGWNIETGVEGALNSLDSDVSLFRIGPDGARTRIDLPVDQAVVTEYRGELFANAGRRLTSKLRVDGGLTFETSRLTVRGDTQAERSLKFLKPSLTFDWRPRPKWHAQLSIKRNVAQLDFGDFISSAELTNDRVDAGNTELLPQRAWDTRLTIDRVVLGDGLAKLELGYSAISLLQDRVPLAGGFDGPGNLGTGTQMFANASIDAPLGHLGIKGGRLTMNVFAQDTSVRDPYTLEDRRFSGALEWDVNISFRQDLGRYAYGGNYGAQPNRIFYRRNELDVSNSDDRLINLFAEYRPTPKTTVTLEVNNVLDNPFRRFRTFFSPDRSSREPVVFEDRVRYQPRLVTLRYKRSFG